MKVRYGVSVVNTNSDLCSASVTRVLYWSMQYNVVMHRVITALDCSCLDPRYMYEIALRWMSHNLTNGKSTLVQVMTWCWKATSHYQNQCWPKSMSLKYGDIRPWWVEASYCFTISATIMNQLDKHTTHITWVLTWQTEFLSPLVLIPRFALLISTTNLSTLQFTWHMACTRLLRWGLGGLNLCTTQHFWPQNYLIT